MEHINSLETFDNLVASGIPENQARAQVKTLNRAFDGIVTKEFLKVSLLDFAREYKLDNLGLKVNFLLWINGISFTAFVGLIIKDFITK